MRAGTAMPPAARAGQAMPADAEVVRHGRQWTGEHAAVDAFVLGADGQERQAAGQPR